MTPQPRNHIHPLNPRLLRQPHLNVWFSIMASGKDRKNLLEINLANTDLIESIRQPKATGFWKEVLSCTIFNLSNSYLQNLHSINFSGQKWCFPRGVAPGVICDSADTIQPATQKHGDRWQRFSISGLRDQRCWNVLSVHAFYDKLVENLWNTVSIGKTETC